LIRYLLDINKEAIQMAKLPFQIDLSDKVVVVTGGTGVLGVQFVDALAACGAKVAIIARRLKMQRKKQRK
jgi:FlaA1/EpsC-like NDP-sugar epimerase